MNRVLVVFGNGFYEDNLIDSAVFLKEKLNFKIEFIFIKDLVKEEKMSMGLDSIYSSKDISNYQTIYNIETEHIKSLEEKIKKFGFEKLEVITGVFVDEVNKAMKLYDFLILDKDISLNDNILNLLKTHYKPILLIGEKSFDKFENICIANDKGLKVNRSVYEFLNNFEVNKKLNSVTIENKRKMDDDSTIAYLKEKEYNVENISLNSLEEAMEILNKADITIMGNLSRTFFIEKIIGKSGLKLLEQLESPIFIG